MQFSYRLLPAVITLSISVVCAPSADALSLAPPLVLAEKYHDQIDLSHYWVSEKYDGARAWWDGEKILSRGGGVYQAPAWFTENLPNQALDGELWIGRGQFQQLMQTIRDQQPDDVAWRSVRFMVFDAPKHKGYFSERQLHLASLVSAIPDPWVEHVVQTRVDSEVSLKALLDSTIKQGGEGLMLQREGSNYIGGRHYGLVKLTRHADAEATVLAHVPGKGKYQAMVGSLLVEDENGVQFKIGSGLTDAQRIDPPPIGSLVTFRYRGRTQSGKPRFARFLRKRVD